jgi:MFS transporter, DHA3 family, tetracycline resistance protein
MMRRPDAYGVYLILSAASALFFTIIFTMAPVYRITAAGLGPLELVLVGTALEATVFLCEIPTGVVADVYSRRLSVIIGYVVIGVAFVLQGAIPLFVAILLTEALYGLGYTFTSGAQEAWIADEIGQERAGEAYLRGAQAAQAASLIGTLVSVALASVDTRLPVIAGGGLFVVLGMYLMLVMPEGGFRAAAPEARRTWHVVLATLRAATDLIGRKPVLLTILAIGAIYGMSSEAFDRLWEAHLLIDLGLPALVLPVAGALQPVVWFGIINAADMLLGLAAVEVARRRVDTTSHRGVAAFLFAVNAWLAVSVLGFAVAGRFDLAVATYLAARLARHVHGPLYTAWVNQSIDDPSVRATVISASSQTDALGQILGGPVVGAIGSLVSIPAALATAAVLLSPALLLFRRTLRRGVQAPKGP